MNTLKSVLKHFENIEQKEVELSSEVVELNVAKDIVAVMKQAQKEWSAGDAKEEKIKGLANDAISDYKQARIKYNEAFQNYKKLESSAKDLGLDVPSDVKALADRAESFIKEGEDKIKSLQNIR